MHSSCTTLALSASMPLQSSPERHMNSSGPFRKHAKTSPSVDLNPSCIALTTNPQTNSSEPSRRRSQMFKLCQREVTGGIQQNALSRHPKATSRQQSMVWTLAAQEMLEIACCRKQMSILHTCMSMECSTVMHTRQRHRAVDQLSMTKLSEPKENA